MTVKRYEEKEIMIGGVLCVAYLIKITNKFGLEYYVPKISPKRNNKVRYIPQELTETKQPSKERSVIE